MKLFSGDVRFWSQGLRGAGQVGLALVAWGCGDPVAQDLDDGDAVASVRVSSSDAAAGVGGMGGGSALDEAEICFSPVVVEEGLPECFVAEVSTETLDCDAPGREVLEPEWEKAARKAECAALELSEAGCEALSLCGLVKLSGKEQEACSAGTGTAPGFCLLDASTASCESAIRIVSAPTESAPVHVYCAVSRVGGSGEP